MPTLLVVLDYRLAPEHPFPAAVDDAVNTYLWLISPEGGNVPPSSVAIMGDSAGGGLTMATLLSLRDRGLPLPACAVGMSPWVDLLISYPSWKTNAKTDYLFQPKGAKLDMPLMYAGSVVRLRARWQVVEAKSPRPHAHPAVPCVLRCACCQGQLVQPAGVAHPRRLDRPAAPPDPGHARRTTFGAGGALPTPLTSSLASPFRAGPAQAGGAETLADEATVFAARAREAGVDVTLQVYPEMVHVFQMMPSNLVADNAARARHAIGEFLASHIAGPPIPALVPAKL